MAGTGIALRRDRSEAVRAIAARRRPTTYEAAR
jgi:hypothetical protein